MTYGLLVFKNIKEKKMEWGMEGEIELASGKEELGPISCQNNPET